MGNGLGRGLSASLFDGSPNEPRAEGLRQLLGETVSSTTRVEEVVVQAALAVLGESFRISSIVLADIGSVDGRLSVGEPQLETIRPRSELWSWSLPSWRDDSLTAFELHGKLWKLLHSADRQAGFFTEAVHGGWAWLGMVGPGGTVAAACFSHEPIGPVEARALWRSIGAIASVLAVPGQGNPDHADGFNGAGRLTVNDADVDGQRLASSSDEPMTYVATLRHGGALTTTGHGESHVLAVARAAASALQPKPTIRFADDVEVGGKTVTVVVIEGPKSATEHLETPIVHVGLSIRPVGDINGGAAAVFDVLGWPDSTGESQG